MRELEVTKKQIMETQKEVIDGQEVFYQFAYLEGQQVENIRIFTTEGAEKSISATYRISSGELDLQTQNIKCCEDIAIIGEIFKTITENFINNQ